MEKCGTDSHVQTDRLANMTKLYSNICPTRFNVTQFILSENCSTCFGWYHHPSSGAQTTVSTASGICHKLLLPAAIVEELELVWVCCGCRTPVPTLLRQRQIAITVWQIPDAVDTVVCTPDDGWWYHAKYVEQFPDKINCVTLHLVGYILEYVISTLKRVCYDTKMPVNFMWNSIFMNLCLEMLWHCESCDFFLSVSAFANL